ncbi:MULTISPECIES: helix-turn-helix transcriptional regulator [unclassified Alcanivorax]|jgi:DNA-binding CsgD family transcriptional regulator|uniref:helix-turn-helix transcriptional regulator n=1 Tax=unclassified Alcanivorax TaxID=2638842 RepID=UPI0008A092C5|nr:MULTISPECIES: helix-turn-helix transcriptional regulator [unclassified Alcanivorax]MED5238558.1 LuxR C-terminal-related transcriptional regulator [Pseudomonadota bacterium]MEE3387938.1 LuxR C-terminal-related transcriptional regulator [Pseudomonadota bacterium]SEG11400.1 regulatory protein, luxR family [Alcanivorax sp. DSM 26293]
MALVLQNEPDLIQALYRSLTHREGFHAFLEKLTNAIKGCAAQLLVINRHPLRMEHLWYHGLSEEFITWYLENNMIAQDVVTNQTVKQTPGLFQSALPLLPDFQPDEDYSKWENEQDMLDSAWLLVDNTRTHSFVLTIQRTVAQGPYQQAELDALNRLVPHIRQTVQLYRQLETRNQAASSLAAIIDVLPDATFVLDSMATILYTNKAARELINRERCLSIRDERFNFAEKDVQAAFFRTSAQVVRSSMGKEDYCSETLFLKRQDRTPLIFVIRPIESSDLLAGGALVSVYEPDNRQLPGAEHIAAYFDLTPAEAQVCEALVSGKDVQAISDQLGRSVSTVRSQIKQIFQKTGCSRQGELISRILAALLR